MTDYFNNISLKNVILNSKPQPSFLTSAVSKTTTLFSEEIYVCKKIMTGPAGIYWKFYTKGKTNSLCQHFFES